MPVAHVEAGPAQPRLGDARGGQPGRHRPRERPAVRARRPTPSRTCGRGHPGRPRPLRRQRHDRHAARQPRRRPAPPTCCADLGLEPGGYGAGHAAPAGERRRRRRCSRGILDGARPRSRGELPLVLPRPPADAASGSTARRARRPRAARRSSRSATSTSSRSRRGAPRAHRLGRHPGGDDGARRPVPDAARQHRAARHRHRGHEHLVGTDPERIVAEAVRVWRDGATPCSPALWDGRAAARIADVLVT